MRFSAIHKLTSYLMCASAFLALALSRELSPLVVGATAVAGVLSYFIEPARWQPAAQQRWIALWNVATIVVFALSAVQAIRGEPLTAGVNFICLLLINKLLNRRASRDYQHAYVLSFLMLVAGAALSAELTYALCFLLYVVFSTWTLTLFHLRREMEDNYLLKHSEEAQSQRVEVERILASRRIVGGSFLAGTALVSLCIFIVSGAAFFLIPRFGFGFFASHGRKTQPTVGFSDRVELGEYGVVKDNPQVVIRVELPAGPPIDALRFRGVAFDHYQSGHWTRTASIPPVPVVRRGRMAFVDPPYTKLDPSIREKLLEGTLVQNIYLDPLDTGVLFGASQPIAFELPREGVLGNVELEGRHAGEVYAVEAHVDVRGHITYSERKSGMRYTVYSRVGPPDAGKVLGSSFGVDDDAPADLRPYLALPALPDRIRELARALVAGQKSRFSQARAVEKYLQTRLRYTLDLKRDERYEPIEDFLFVQKAGHCEYFASAMAVLLRTVGLPTRVVNGFYGGEWNSYGHFLAVRQGDAHSWVEVWLGDAGWVTFDPTPSSPPGASSSGLSQRLRLLFDTVELAWFKYVIEYDLGKQAELAQGARRAFTTSLSPANVRDTLKHATMPIAVVGAIVAIVVLFRRRRFVGSPKKRSTDVLIGRALDALEKRGLPRGLGETSRELGRRALEAHDPGASAFISLVERCYEVRYGDVQVAGAELDRLLAEVLRPTAVDPAVRAATLR